MIKYITNNYIYLYIYIKYNEYYKAHLIYMVNFEY